MRQERSDLKGAASRLREALALAVELTMRPEIALPGEPRAPLPSRTDLPRFVQFLLAGLTTLALAHLLRRLIEASAIAAGRRIASGLVAKRA